VILIGQFDSPFVRRVGIALELYGLSFEHRPWSVFGDADKLAAVNPLMRVPTLVLDDGTVLSETFVILDTLDHFVSPSSCLLPSDPLLRRKAMRICGLASGISDKAVSLTYETKFHDAPNAKLAARIETQIRGVLALLETERSEVSSAHWIHDRLTHADIAVAASLRHLFEAQTDRFTADDYPALARHCASCEALGVFQKISQPFVFIPPKA
jgi:glutathione S-transferase